MECALKACICKEVKRFDFPNKKLSEDSWSHDLVKLVRTAGLQRELENESRRNQEFELNWSVTKDWSEQRRYVLEIPKEEAQEFYRAIAARKNGVLNWIRRHW